MTSKTDKAALASNYEKNKRKLSRTISKVVKSLSSLNINEKNEQLQTLQRQLRTLDKQLVNQDKDEVTIGKKASKTRSKKNKKSETEKKDSKDDGGQRIGSFRLLPLGIGVKSQVKSKAVSCSLNDAVARRTKSTQKELIPKSNAAKKKSSQRKCTELVNEYLTFESEFTEENHKKSKKERKKLKTLKEISSKMEKSSLEVQKVMSSVKKKEISVEKSKVKNQKPNKLLESEGPKLSNFMSLKEQYYYISSDESSLGTKSPNIIVDKVAKNKKPTKSAELGEPKFSNFVSLSEQYYFLTAIQSCEVVNTHDTKSENKVKAVKESKKKKKKSKKQNSDPGMTNNASSSAVAGMLANQISEIEIKVSNMTVSETTNLDSSKASDDQSILQKVGRRRKKKIAQLANITCLPNSSDNTAQKTCDYPADVSSNIKNTSASVASLSTGNQGKKNKSKHEKKKNKGLKEEEDNFENYLSEMEVFNHLRDGTLVSGQLRINVRDYNAAYVSSKNESESDFLIVGIRNRNRALEGDIVVLSILPEKMWRITSSGIQKTAKVVFIQEAVHSRRGIGTLKVMADKNPEFALFSPNDSRLPRWQVPMYSCPADFYSNPSKYKNILFEGVLTNWITPKLSRGFITEMLGEKGTIEAETMSLLCEADCDTTPIPQSMYEASMQGIVFDEKILQNRQDLRCECIFSIDPEGAKDLDDAMSCKKLPNGNYEVGVHISDVAFYIQQGTQFDKAICKKATTVYLVQKAFHMLPQELCYLCSLTPGEDKLAFSVFWELTPCAEIVSHRFTRSIIHSCVQLTYTHAQKVINDPDAASYDFPTIMNGYTEKDCAQRITQLHCLATILRKNRFDNGALKIEIPKLWFKLDPTSGLPNFCSPYVQQESNWLIEEFMLLANFTVGKHIYNTYPDIALLRQHKSPNRNALSELKKSLDKEEVFIDISSGATLYQSLSQFEGADLESEAKRVVLSNLIAKPMPKALYYASGLKREASDFWHFALNKDYYTHFTSPIRRYADIIVHRLLAASLGYCEKPNYTEQEIQNAASISNKQKYCAKRAGELSSKLFLTLYVAAHGPFIEKAAVLDIKDHSFDCVILRFGYIARVYTNNLTSEAKVAHQVEDGVSSIFVYWKENVKKNIKASIQLIKMFGLVTVELKKSETDMKLETKLLPFY